MLVLVAASWGMPLTLGILTPALPQIGNYFADQPDKDLYIGLLATAPAFSAALLAPVAGVFVDWLGARRLLIGSLVAFVLFGVAPYWVGGLTPILVLRILLGIAMTGAVVSSTALITQSCEAPARDRWLGIQAATSNGVGILTLGIGGLVATLGWRETFLVHFAVIPVLAATLLLVKSAGGPGIRTVQAAPEKTDLPWMRLSWILALLVSGTTVMFVAVLQSSFLLSGLGMAEPARIGLAISVICSGAILGSIALGAVARLRPLPRLALSYAVSGAGMALMAVSTGIPLAIAGGFLTAMGMGICLPTAMSLTIGMVEPGARGRVSGLAMAAMFAGQFFNPVLFSWLNALTHSIAGSIGIVATMALMISAALFAGRRMTPARQD